MASFDMQALDPAIRAYVGEVKRNLHGVIPGQVLEPLLQETIYWMQRQAAMFEFDGLSREDAVKKAVEMDETPKSTSLGLIEDYFESENYGPLIKRLGRANAIVFTIFGLGTAAYLLLLELVIAYPSTSPITTSWTPAMVHRFYPQALPFPELTWQFMVTLGYPVIAPWILGWIAGRLVPIRSGIVVAMGLLPIMLITLLVGLSLMPDKTGLFYFVLQAFYWLPVGSLMAHFSSTLLRRNRQRTR
ncbi:MAG: hypothetical protein P4L46_01565 [Fimbriimonas sp.]|nr:hypothetical protein [Fimbriimonas sp.]